MSKQILIEDIYPLSPMQEGMLFHSLEEPESGIYFEQVACTLAGELDVPALERAWQRVVDRHASLRTAFVWQQRQEPFQVVFKAAQLPWEHRDWRALAADEQQQRLRELLAADRRRGFDLARPPLMRLFLLRLAEDVWRLLWSCHHLLIDGWSQNQILREVLACYQAFAGGREPRLEPSLPYSRYIAWLRRQDPARSEEFWQRQLRGFGSATPLPEDKPGTAADGREEVFSGRREVRLSAESTARLYAAAQRERLTPSTFVQAAWALLLARYSATEDVVFGVTVSGRPAALPGVETMTGLFVNTLAMRVRPAPEEPAPAWLARLGRQQTEIGEHEATPLASLRRWSEIPPGQPLFESILVFENYPMDEALLDWGPRLTIREIEHLGKTNYPLTAGAVPGRQLKLEIVYDLRRFEAATAERLARHWRILLEALAGEPRWRLAAVPMLSAAERHQASVEWSAGEAGPSETGLVHRLFEAQAARRPEAVAVLCGERSLTYGQLDAWANRVAHRLLDSGIGLESRVAIFAERSPAVVAGVLGVLKAGGAYLPLDSQHPAERLEAVLAESAAAAVLTQKHLVERLRLPAGVPVLLLDDLTAGDGSRPSRPARAVSEGNLAYVIYTSGSTGRPKGVLLHHRGLSCLQAAQRGLLGIREDDRVLQFASLAFDASISEICMALISGAALVLAPREVLAAPAELERLIEKHAVTVATFPPTLLGVLPPRSASLRLVLSAGESCSAELAARWGRERTLINAYGPTEVTVCSTMGRCDPDDPRPPALGVPIAPARVYLLDRLLRPVPIGAPGELYLAGEGVARGYLDDPGATASAFLPDPFDPVPGRRMYRSGDLARRRSDGGLAFLGRRDHQVKVRGHRVELGEIEAALSRHPGVRQAVVIARDEGDGRRLVAYLVAEGEPAPAADELRGFLERRLPAPMLPAVFVTLTALPTTASGKVDRRALPAPERLRPDLEKAFVPPRTPTESRLAEIWCQILGLERVGVEDNFFTLGGDSMLSLQVVSEARRRGIAITPKQAMEHPTVAALAAAAEAATPRPADRAPVAGDVPLLPIQRWFFERRLEEAEHWNQAVLLRPRLAVDVAALARAFGHLFAHHDALRLCFAPPDGSGRARQGLASPRVQAPFVRIDLRALPASAARRGLAAALDVLQTGFDLTRGPLARAAWLDLGGGSPGRLALVAHHLIVDVVSWRILLADLETAYRQLLQGEAVRLGGPATPFMAWAVRLAAWAGADGLRDQAALWCEPREVPRLPIDNPGGGNRQGSADAVRASLTREETRALLQEAAPAYRMRADEVMLTALARTVRGWVGAGPLWIDVEGHGREAPFDDVDLSSTVGWLTSSFPVALDVPEEADAGRALRTVKERLRRIPLHGLGYGVLRYLAGSRELSELPAAEISFNYLGQLDAALPAAALFEQAPEPAGAVRSPRGARSHLLEVSGSILDGRLEMEWTYSESLHRRQTIERLAQGFLEDLRALLAHCRGGAGFGYTPSDFPLAALDQEALDRLLAGERGVEDLYPLAPLQQGLLFHGVAAPGRGEYVVQLTCRFDRPLDVDRFRRAWERVAARHPVLRTAFLWQGLTTPLQAVRSAVDLPWRELDWRTVPAGERQERLAAWLEEDRRLGFDLRRAPLFRLTLLRLADEAYRFVWSLHHLLMDGWSLSLLLKEVFVFYAEPAPRLAAVRPYRDFIAWLARQDLKRAETFWRGRLEGFTAPTPIGLAPRGGEPSPQGLERALPAAATAALEALARRHGLTTTTLVLGAWGLLLGRASGEGDVVFGLTVAGRSAELGDMESMVGLFINTLPVRLRLPAAQEALAWLAGAQRQRAEMQPFEHSPLAAVQRWSGVPGGRELFESALVFENYPIDAAVYEAAERLGAREVSTLERTHYPLTLTAVPGSELRLRIDYDGRRFDRTAALRLLEHLLRLLTALAPGRRLGELPWLGPGEEQQLLREWNDTRDLSPRRPSLHEVFERQAERHPELVAAELHGERLSYGELDARANQLAQHLLALGVGAGDLVAICIGRSLALPLAILGVLKAGAAYLPLDPKYPEERLAFMLQDARPGVVLTEERSDGRLPSGLGGERVYLDRDGPLIARRAAASPAVPVDPESLCYVIYTSGSTGRPKGVMVRHGGACNLAEAQQATFQAAPGSRHLQFSSLNFDASIFEMILAWRAGGCVVLAAEEEVLPGPGLLRLLREHGIGQATLPPSVLTATPVAELPDLRSVVVAGEACPAELVAGWAPGRRLWNAYGPTEATVWATAFECRDGGGRPPIGRPIPNARIVVADRDLRPQPIGVAGELLIGGEGLARGYLRQPELTAERFVPDPFDGARGGRLYRSGDLVRLLAEGNLEFLGRIDHQVKVRGFRIELGEIEAALGEHPGVREAVVSSREDSPGEPRLVAYVVGKSEPPPSASELREFLRRLLPDHMVPAAFVHLRELPLTPNRKVDRRALPAPEAVRSGLERSFVAPRSAVERELAAIWSAVLKVDRVGVDDNFFELGGDSILSLRVVARAEEAGLRLTPRQLLEQPTIGELAALVEAAGERREEREPAGEVPLTPIQSWFFELPLPRPEHFNMALLLTVEPGLATGVLAAAARAVAGHHDALRLRFSRREPEGWRQELAQHPAPVSLLEVDLAALPPEAAADLIAAAADRLHASLDLQRGPLLRMALFRRRRGQPGRLLIIAHHLVVDAVSWRIFVQDLATACEQLRGGAPVALAPPAVPFARWSRRLSAHASSGALEPEIEYWLAPSRRRVEPLPVDGPGGANVEAASRTVTVGLGAEETAALLSDALRPYRLRVEEVLLTALALTLGEWTGRSSLLIDVESHGREEVFADLHPARTLGWLTCLAPVFLELPRDGDEGAALTAVKEQLRRLPQHGLGYGLLRYLGEGAVARELRAQPAPEVSFNYLGKLDQGLPDSALFAPAPEPVGSGRSPLAPRTHRLEVNGSIVGGELRVELTYGTGLHRAATMDRLARRFREHLQALLEHCLSVEAGRFTPSDFPLVALDQQKLDQIVARFGKTRSARR
jgi:amino acid adenylation domain-containing protein/non-ribosomal peptide synthase protein (TIGR01720 family)